MSGGQPAVFLVVSYDISDDKRRVRLAKIMEDYLTRVQYSVFEGEIDDKHYQEMAKRLKKVIALAEDSVRVYHLCEACLNRTEIIGTGHLTKDPEVYMI